MILRFTIRYGKNNMSNSLIICSGSEQTTVGTAIFDCFQGGNSVDATETRTQVIMRSAGTASKLLVNVLANSANQSTVKTRVNAGAGAQTATITASTPGLYEDALNSDTITAGQKWDYQINPGSAAALNCSLIQVLFAATTNTVSKFVANGFQGVTGFTASTNVFWMLSGLTAISNNSDTLSRTRIRKAGSFQNIYVNVTTASASTTHSVTLNDNGANTLLKATATAGTTGFFEDTSDVVTITTGHDYNYQFTPGATVTNLVVSSVGVEYSSSAGCSIQVIGNTGGLTAVKGNTDIFQYIGGGCDNTTPPATESQAQTRARDTTFKIDNLGFMIQTNGTTVVTNSVTVRKNAADTALNGTFTTATGLIEDNLDSFTISAATDLLDHRIRNASTAGGSHSILFYWFAVHFTAVTPGVTPKGFSRSFDTTSDFSPSFGIEPPVFG